LQNPLSRRTWVIPGLVAAILFVGAVASNLVASDLQTTLKPYRSWVWLTCAVSLIFTVAAAIVEARRRDHSSVSNAEEVTDHPEKVGTRNAIGERSVAVNGNVEGSTMIPGNRNVVGSKIDGDMVARDKVTYTINQAASTAINALHQLRAPVGDFVGRELEINALVNALRRNSRAWITGISGMGGIGKTELALIVAERLARDYPDAQFFINLQGTDTNPRPPQEVLATCIRAFLGPEARLPEDLDQLSQLYLSQLSGKRVLLLLDNAADSAQVRPLLPPPGSALLVTSRDAIALPGITPLTLNPLTDKEARELLLEIAPRAESAVQQICSLCGYLPLAIRAAGSLLAITADLDSVNYAAQLTDERRRLERIGTEGVELGLEASFNLSYARLTSEAARVFRLLSVFPATFDMVAEEVVCSDAEHAQLSDLVRRSLVLYESSSKRYRLHDLSRLFAAAKLGDEERALGLKRHATHYKNVLAAAEELYHSGGEALLRGLALFDLEWGNIDAGHAWVAAQDATTDQDISQLGTAYPDAANILHLRQHAHERIRWLEIALAAAGRIKDRVGEGIALGNLGNAYLDLGETQKAIDLYQQALIIDREIGHRRREGTDLGNLGVAHKKFGETKRAIEFYEQQLVIVREIGDRRGEGSALGNLGNVYLDLGETQRAIELYQQALRITQQMGDRRGEGADLGNLGNAYANLGETRRAIEFYEQAVRVAHEIGDRRGEGTTLWNMSLALDQLGERVQAIQRVEQALAIFEQIENSNVARVRAKLAAWHQASSDS
jgi:tetratricopeptide (TPR) repeat protein